VQKLARFIYFKLLAWTLVGTFPSHLNKFVIIVVPHTSWVDFFLGLLIRKVWNEQINFIAKKSLFDTPFGWFFRWTGGAPIDRNKTSDTVIATAKIFSDRKQFRLALSPEGTRKKVGQWKTGFYYIAKTAEVPIVMVAFDYGKREIKVSEPHYTSSNKVADFTVYEAFFKGVQGKVPRK